MVFIRAQRFQQTAKDKSIVNKDGKSLGIQRFQGFLDYKGYLDVRSVAINGYGAKSYGWSTEQDLFINHVHRDKKITQEVSEALRNPRLDSTFCRIITYQLVNEPSSRRSCGPPSHLNS